MDNLPNTDANIDYFKRTEMLFGKEAMQKFSSCRIVIVGLGGVGSAVVEMLVRSGLGTVVIVDFDKISESDLNRQIISLTDNIGHKKVDALSERIRLINPAATVIKYDSFCDETNRDEIFNGCDYIVDAIDSLNPKVSLLEYAYNKKINIISCMGAGNRIDPAKISIDDISNAKGCPLLNRVKKYLKKRNIFNGIPVVFSNEKPILLQEGTLNETFRGRSRQTIGSVAHMPIIIAGWAASYILKEISLSDK